jgi:hypothetical protein
MERRPGSMHCARAAGLLHGHALGTAKQPSRDGYLHAQQHAKDPCQWLSFLRASEGLSRWSAGQAACTARELPACCMVTHWAQPNNQAVTGIYMLSSMQRTPASGSPSHVPAQPSLLSTGLGLAHPTPNMMHRSAVSPSHLHLPQRQQLLLTTARRHLRQLLLYLRVKRVCKKPVAPVGMCNSRARQAQLYGVMAPDTMARFQTNAASVC